jgi:D-alanyl-lipoteichoic acid acyltransferase DltB (MBOAT superfamily)
LPIGLTFQALQSVIYIIYVYRGKFVQEKKVIDFLNVTTFFPMLLNILLLPYHSVSDIFKKKREFNYQLALDGVSLIFFGLFKKIVVSQRMATLYVGIFHTHYTRSFSLLLIAIAPIFIFIEYSSYIDILRGLCKVFNYDVPEVYNISYTGMSFTTILKETHKGFYQWLKENIYLPLLSFGTSKLDIILWRFIVVFFASVLIFHSLGIQLSFFIFLFLQIDKVLCKIEIRSIRILKNTAMWFLGWIFLIFISLVFLKGSLPQGLILIRNLSFKSMAGFPPHNFVSLGTDTTIALICSVIIMALELSKSRTSRMFKQAPSFIQWGLNCFLLIFVSFFYFGNGIIFLFCSI